MQTETINRRATRANAVACPIFLARGTSTIFLDVFFPEHSNVLYSSFKMPTVYCLLVYMLHESRSLSFIHWYVPNSSNSEWVVHGRCSVYLFHFLFVCFLAISSCFPTPNYFLLSLACTWSHLATSAPNFSYQWGAVPRWQRNRMGRPLSSPQICLKITWMLSNFHKTTFERWWRTPVTLKGSTVSSKEGIWLLAYLLSCLLTLPFLPQVTSMSFLPLLFST